MGKECLNPPLKDLVLVNFATKLRGIFFASNVPVIGNCFMFRLRNLACSGLFNRMFEPLHEFHRNLLLLSPTLTRIIDRRGCGDPAFLVRTFPPCLHKKKAGIPTFRALTRADANAVNRSFPISGVVL